MLVERLKSDKSNAHKVQKELIETFRANMSNQSRIQTAVLVILEAETFEEFIETITQDLPVLLDVDTINLVIEATSKEVPFVNQSGIRFAKPGFVRSWLGDGDALLQPNINGHEEIFGPGAGLVKKPRSAPHRNQHQHPRRHHRLRIPQPRSLQPRTGDRPGRLPRAGCGTLFPHLAGCERLKKIR